MNIHSLRSDTKNMDKLTEQRPAETCCEMCGALRKCGQADHHETYNTGDLLLRLANMYFSEDRDCYLYLLLRIQRPAINKHEAARILNISAPKLSRLLNKMAKKNPELKTFLGFSSPKAQSQHRRRSIGPTSKHAGISLNAAREQWEVRIAGVYKDSFGTENEAIRFRSTFK